MRWRLPVFFVVALAAATAANDGSPLSIVLVVALAVAAVAAIYYADTPR